MAGESGFVERRVSGMLARLVAEEPVLALHGPRSVGKSTVLRILAEAHGVEVIDLDDIEVRPGVAVITGSTRQDALPRTAQALTGRLHTVTIWPLSQGELAASHENLPEGLQADPGTTVAQYPISGTTRGEYVARVCAGGLPLAVRRSQSGRARWFDARRQRPTFGSWRTCSW